MDSHDQRGKVRQLADDFAWLEAHCLKQPDLAAHAAHLRMAAALTRNVVGPSVEGQPAVPLFLAVVGGAGAGKSTAINFLAGYAVAEANPQAGYTRHPTAFLPAALGSSWPNTLGFLGPLTRTTEPKPANLDEEVYQVRRVPALKSDTDPLADFVLWDCPDMTTWASTGYVGRLMEVVGLADVIVYVASDERYNDEIPTQFLHHVVRAGKAVVVVLTKMREADVAGLTAHFRQEVLGRLPRGEGGEIPPVPCVAVPHLSAEARRDPSGLGSKYRAALVNQVRVLCPTPEATRERTVRNALIYLQTAGEGLLDVARRDLSELELWKALVESARDDFEDRYAREFLSGEAFRRFDRTREQVVEMLELPGPGKVVSSALALLRLPYRYARDFVRKLLDRPEMPTQPERVVLATALAAMLDGLQAEALRRAPSHPVWQAVTRGFDANLKSQTLDAFETLYRDYEAAETDELDAAAKAVPNRLAAHTVPLLLLRLLVAGIDLAAIAAVLTFTWVPSLYQLLLIPLAVSLTRQVVEVVAGQVVDFGRYRLRNHRLALVREKLSGPIARRLIDWPTSGGSAMQKLQQVLLRVPLTIRDLAERLTPVAPASVPAPAIAPEVAAS
jgi:hypothetical protein